MATYQPINHYNSCSFLICYEKMKVIIQRNTFSPKIFVILITSPFSFSNDLEI